MTRLRRSLSALLVLGAVAWAAPAYADAVTFWNNVTLTAVSNTTTGRPGPPGLLDIAIVQAAVHDAVQAFEHRFEPYRVNIPNAAGLPAAAVAAAAHDLLVLLYPAQQGGLDTQYLKFLQDNGLVGNAGIAVGQQAAKALHTQYRALQTFPPFTGGPQPGEWRPTPSYIGSPPMPPPFAPMAFVFLASTQPFTLNRPSQFRPQPPPPLTSQGYHRAYDEVKEFGARFGSSRTADRPISPISGRKTSSRCGTVRFESSSRTRTTRSTTLATVLVCSPSPVSRRPMRQSRPGKANSTSISGGR